MMMIIIIILTIIIIIIIIIVISNGNRTEWITIQGVETFEITSPYQLLESITKCENLSLGIFINARERFQSKNMISYNFGSNYRNVEARQNDELFKRKITFLFCI